jgi:hypothetical protein
VLTEELLGIKVIFVPSIAILKKYDWTIFICQYQKIKPILYNCILGYNNITTWLSLPGDENFSCYFVPFPVHTVLTLTKHFHIKILYGFSKMLNLMLIRKTKISSKKGNNKKLMDKWRF